MKRLDKDKKPKVKIPEGKKTKSTETRKAQGQNKDEAVNKEDVTEKTSRGKLATEKVVKERSKSLDHSSKIVKQERNTVRTTGKVPAAKSSDVKRISKPNQLTGFQDENTANASIQTRTHARKDTTIADSKRKSSQKPERRARPQNNCKIYIQELFPFLKCQTETACMAQGMESMLTPKHVSYTHSSGTNDFMIKSSSRKKHQSYEN